MRARLSSSGTVPIDWGSVVRPAKNERLPAYIESLRGNNLVRSLRGLFLARGRSVKNLYGQGHTENQVTRALPPRGRDTRTDAGVWGTIVHPEATFRNTPKGGIEVWISDYLRYSSKRYRLVGADSQEDLPQSVSNQVTVAQIIRSSGRNWLLPRSLQFSFQLLSKRRLLEGVLIIHRIDLVWVVRLLQPKSSILLVIHTDLLAQKTIGESSWRRIPPALYFFYEKWALSRVDLVASQASSDFERVKSLAKTSQLVPGWYDHSVFYEDTDQTREDIILWAGRLEHTKNPLLALHSFAQSGLCDGYTLRFLGAGSLRESLTQEIARLGLTDRVEILGYVDQQQLAHHLRQSKILIHTSYFEATPKIFLEAFGCGVNVVAHERNDPEGLCLTAPEGFRSDEYSAKGFGAALNRSAAYYANSTTAVSLDARRASRVVPNLEALWLEHFAVSTGKN
jgi:glycosyltransferase involved in cell wall biosynthesis